MPYGPEYPQWYPAPKNSKPILLLLLHSHLWQKTRSFHSGSRARSTFIERDKTSLQSIGSLLLLEAEALILPAAPLT